MTELINYYNEKLPIPSRIAVTINGSVHKYKRTSTHNKDKISKGMIDCSPIRSLKSKSADYL